MLSFVYGFLKFLSNELTHLFSLNLFHSISHKLVSKLIMFTNYFFHVFLKFLSDTHRLKIFIISDGFFSFFSQLPYKFLSLFNPLSNILCNVFQFCLNFPQFPKFSSSFIKFFSFLLNFFQVYYLFFHKYFLLVRNYHPLLIFPQFSISIQFYLKFPQFFLPFHSGSLLFPRNPQILLLIFIKFSSNSV